MGFTEVLNQNISAPVIVYPFPLSLINVGAYGQSIISFVNALGRQIDVFLLGIDESQQIAQFIPEELGEEVSSGLNYVKVKNKRFGVKSNTLFFTSQVAEFINDVKKNNQVFVYTRDLKTLRNLQYRKWENGAPQWILEAHQIKSEVFCRQGKYKKLKAEVRLEREVYQKLDLLFPISTMLQRSIYRKYDVGHVAGDILPVGVADRFFLSECNEKEYDLVYAGGFVKWKGVEVIVKALKLLKDKGHDLKLLMIGGNEEQVVWMKGLVEKNNLIDNISITGRLNNRKIPAMLAKARVGIVTVTYDGDGMLFTSPLKLYEYLAAGLSVVAARVPVLQADIPENLVNWAIPESPESYSEAVLSALSESTINADDRIQYANKYKWSARAEKVIRMLKRN